MPATFKAVLKPEPKADGTHAIRIRVHTPGCTRFYGTGLFIPKTFWNKTAKEHLANWIITRFKNHREYNDSITSDLEALAKIARENKAFTADQIIAAHKGQPQPEEPAKGFLNFCSVWIARKRSLNQADTALLYLHARDRLLRFAGPDPDEEKLLTSKGVAAFQNYLLNLKRKKQPDVNRFSPSTIKQTISLLATMYAKAFAEGYVSAPGNPFDSSGITVQPKKKDRPTEDQVLSLLTLPIKPSQVHARNAFLLQYFIKGARISEALTLTWENVKPDRIEYAPKKRSKELKIVKRHPGIDWILNQYTHGPGPILPILTAEEIKLPKVEFIEIVRIRTGTLNYHLRGIGKLLNLPFRLSTHMARHAFTDTLLTETNDLREVQKQIGHASLQSTERYTRELLQDKLDQTTDKVFKKIAVILKES